MKSSFWAIILCGLFALSLCIGLWLLRPTDAARAEIWSEGRLIASLNLSEEKSIEVRTDQGSNVVTVRDGKIAVTEASCPDHYCMHRGWCSGGAQIVCLPNRLVIRFVGGAAPDGIAG